MGNKKFSKIADRSAFGISLSKSETLNSIFNTLNTDGIFEIWNVGLDVDGDMSLPNLEGQPTKIMGEEINNTFLKLGYKKYMFISEKRLLQFFKG
jgi:hypothetical protein